MAVVGVATVGLVGTSVLAGKKGGSRTLPTTGNDFLMPGTQPNADTLQFDPIQSSLNCTFCHSDFSPTTAPFDGWVVSMMGQATRDPIWHAALAIANKDANVSGEFCIRCHAPGPWLAGKATTGTFAEFDSSDFDGVNCDLCHRVVSPVPGKNPAIGYPGDPQDPDTPILAALQKEGNLPTGAGNARYVVDPLDNRRGPLSDVPENLHGLTYNGVPVKIITSPLHTSGDFCATCHDVSNPVFEKQKDGTYKPGRLNAEHPTQNPHDMFPEQRTYSEWSLSDFASKGVVFADDRFGGPDHPTGVMQSCQDCHMPINYGGACAFADNPPFFYRDVPQHSFSGANTWVIGAVRQQLGEEADYIGLTQERVDAAQARNIQMLRDASDMVLTQNGTLLDVQVINQTAHKLPTGYPEGRRMWLDVRFLDINGATLAEIGGYDFKTATLNAKGAKIWEAKHAVGPDVAKLVGLPAFAENHLTLNNVKLKDNRIPPRGFNNAAFAAVGAPVIGATYKDGQYWDDTLYTIPAAATKAVVTLYYQTTTREYIEFLRDANVTDGTGQLAYDLWSKFGKSAPIDMDHVELDLSAPEPADLNGDGWVGGADLAILLGAWGTAGPGDLNGDGIVGGPDLAIMLGAWD